MTGFCKQIDVGMGGKGLAYGEWAKTRLGERQGSIDRAGGELKRQIGSGKKWGQKGYTMLT